MSKKQNVLIISIFVTIFLILSSIVLKLLYDNTKVEIPISSNITSYEKKNYDDNVLFDYSIIHLANEYNVNNDNYLISPLSIGYALSMAKDGSKNNTKIELNNLIGNYTLPTSLNIKNKVSLANATFINDLYKSSINKDFEKLVKDKYNAEILYDAFNNPDKINNWVNNKTYKMIPKLLNETSKETILYIVNAIAINLQWEDKFDCESTSEGIFYKNDNTQINTAMMHSSNDFDYIYNDNAQGIVKDYAIYDINTGNIIEKDNGTSVQLEYIAVLPNEDLKTYINNFNSDELNSLLDNKIHSSDDYELSIPKYNYDYTYDNLKVSLNKLGVNDLFDPINADLSNMINGVQAFAGNIIHKTHIEVSESGTKAAAVTGTDFYATSVLMEEDRKITFDKPFMYIIREKDTSSIWFFGTVYSPMLFEDNNCEE